eukprot:TRINITY_DN10149_c0_g1_i1.p1 TRINITY_DN10149_c0_g1~~TRINITY_DN10149_c0_g1_i1.p1  ORF type:complete len:109 (+),score=24.02 TRINITY_DN10149_c0_g1_i1:45-329(+)
MADLKDYRFSPDDKKQLELLQKNPNVNSGNKALLSFALARACGQQQEFNLAFEKMAEANAVFQQHRPFKEDLFIKMINNMITYLDKPSSNPLAY